jgi:hypothetical protein
MPNTWSNGRPKPSDTAKWAPLFVQRALGPRSRIAIAVWYGGCRVRQKNRAGAAQVLQSAYDRFTEGFNTGDLKEAKLFLEAL